MTTHLLRIPGEAPGDTIYEALSPTMRAQLRKEPDRDTWDVTLLDGGNGIIDSRGPYNSLDAALIDLPRTFSRPLILPDVESHSGVRLGDLVQAARDMLLPRRSR